MGASSTGVGEHICEEEEGPSGAHHDIHEDDLDFIPEEDMSVEEEEGGGTKTKICTPTPVTKLEAGIICGRQQEFMVDMAHVSEPKSPVTNMRILDRGHAQYIYDRLLKRISVATLTLRPMSYYDAQSQSRINFDVMGGRDHFEKVWKTWPEGATNDEKMENMMKTITWEPCDGQHIVYACKVLGGQAFAAGAITEEEFNSIFKHRRAILVVYNNPKMYIEMLKRQNDFHKPHWKDTHTVAWQTLIKLRTLWNEYGRPKPKDVRDVEKRGDMFICMAAVLHLKLDAEKNLNITKVSSKLNDWITHACREDDEAFEDLIRIGQEMDAHILYQDPSKEVAWNKFMMKKIENDKAKEPRHVPLTINWLRPFRGLQDEDFKELVHMALYDHSRKRQRLYFHDVDKPYPERNTVEYVSVRLRQ